MDLLNLAREKKVLLVAHRGTCGGNIPCNSLTAFKAALLAGTDMVELDVEKSVDGELFVQHPGMEPVHLRMKDSIKRYPASVVEQFQLSNWDHVVTQYPILRLEEALSYLKGKCFVNVDKFWENPKEISALIRKLGMEDQILIKTDCKPEYLDAVETYAPDIPFMGLTRSGLDVHEELMRRRLRYVGLETLFAEENAENASEQFIRHLHADGKIVWVNAIVYNYKAVLAGGHNDDISLSEDPEFGWGWLADRGFDLIQTDFVYQCRRFLEETGRRRV
ncbi:MAG: glycerophosphodiester phosphodiesterase family protein [Lachnospiraceae bacterium]|nr:glycerophosphodiester phosphodiesterase family protein [Lachnospiraceae bacterium]